MKCPQWTVYASVRDRKWASQYMYHMLCKVHSPAHAPCEWACLHLPQQPIPAGGNSRMPVSATPGPLRWGPWPRGPPARPARPSIGRRAENPDPPQAPAPVSGLDHRSSNRAIRHRTLAPGAIFADFFAGRDGIAGRLTRYWLVLYQCNSQDCLFATRTISYSNGVAIGRSLQSPISGTCHEAHEPTKGETLQIHDV